MSKESLYPSSSLHCSSASAQTEPSSTAPQFFHSQKEITSVLKCRWGNRRFDIFPALSPFIVRDPENTQPTNGGAEREINVISFQKSTDTLHIHAKYHPSLSSHFLPLFFPTTCYFFLHILEGAIPTVLNKLQCYADLFIQNRHTSWNVKESFFSK